MYMLYIEPIYLIYCRICTSVKPCQSAFKYSITSVLANAFMTMSVVIRVDTFHPTIARENTSIIKAV